MKINSKFLGTQEINPDTIIHFPHGLTGLAERKDFSLFHEVDKTRVFWLQSLEDEELNFSICDPELFNIAYDIRLSDEDCEALQLENPEDVAILVMLNRDEGEEQSPELRANLNGPLIINMSRRLGLQKVLVKPQRHVLLRALD